jgi:hypothetical protein
MVKKDEKKLKAPMVLRVDDIWMMKDADDFLRYLKFEVINYGYMIGHLYKSFHLVTVYGSHYSTSLNSLLIFFATWRLIDLIELHVIMKRYNYSQKLFYAKTIIIYVILLGVAVFYFKYHDKICTSGQVYGSRWTLVELTCGLVL